MEANWFQLVHVLTNRTLRLLTPPHEQEWMLLAVTRAESDGAGKQTWFAFEPAPDKGGGRGGGKGGGGDAVEGYLRVHPSATGAYINFRGAELVRGHGNTPPRRGAAHWQPAGRLSSTLMRLHRVSAAQFAADASKWAERKRNCFAPVFPPDSAPGLDLAPKGARSSRSSLIAHFASVLSPSLLQPGGAVPSAFPSWDVACGLYYAEAVCMAIAAVHGVGAGGWARTPALVQLRWARLDCDKYVDARKTQLHAQPQPSPAQENGAQALRSAARGRSDGLHCVKPIDNVLLLVVSNRPNEFLCHYLSTALLHGLRPTVLGWDAASWVESRSPPPWTFHLGAKLVLPLHYLNACEYDNSTLLVFTDHDVVFQGGYADLKRAYAAATRRGSSIVFSTEAESYPLELRDYYPHAPRTAPLKYLNSGMWAATVGGAKQMLSAMTALSTTNTMDRLLHFYLNWHLIDRSRETTPSVYADNDQVTYAGLFIAQRFAAECEKSAIVRAPRNWRCTPPLLDGDRRCIDISRKPLCTSANLRRFPTESERISLDYELRLFENLYHAGRHTLDNGRLRHASGSTPLVVHFNGPAKVSFERAWGLPWAEPTASPAKQLRNAITRAFKPQQRARAQLDFESAVTFLDSTFRKIETVGPLNYMCDEI